MAERGLLKKLLLRPNQEIAVLNPPSSGFLRSLGAMPEGVEVAARSQSGLDFVLLFVKDAAELREFAPKATRRLKPDGIFWIAYRKQTSKVKTDLNRDILWTLMEKHGLAGVAMVSIDNVWSAMRFRPADRVGKTGR
jgi:hypothetical protein